MAWAYHEAAPLLRLEAEELPELQLDASSVDAMVADTVLSADGRALTDLRLSLRNELLPYLGLTLPEGASVRSATVGGQPVRPGLTEDGRLLLPLERSSTSFLVGLVLSHQGGDQLALPAVDLPVSSVAWSLHLPPGYPTAHLTDDGGQHQVGSGSWLTASHGSVQGGAGGAPRTIQVPDQVQVLTVRRHWLDPGEVVRAAVGVPSRAVQWLAWLAAGLFGVFVTSRVPWLSWWRRMVADLPAPPRGGRLVGRLFMAGIVAALWSLLGVGLLLS
jgi:hypothetical protein